MKKQKTAKGSAELPKDETLDKAVAMHAKLGALLHSCDVQDHAIRDAAMQMHDTANGEIAKMAKILRKQGANFDPALARLYAQALQKRTDTQHVIHKTRTRTWDDGPESQL
jgi:hypothetical protein